jgi:pimeloyl-ACP methyl ester carboxylesterase
MSKLLAFPQARSSDAPPVIALHCAGGSGRAWRHLSPALGGCFNVLAPDLIGHGTTPHWTGPGRFRLADEAASVVKAIDALPGNVHLVGHSLGGAVALRVAVQRPHRIASLSLYEPVAFHVLATCGDEGRHWMRDLRAVAWDIERSVTAGMIRLGVARFCDYWNGRGVFDTLRPEAQGDLEHYIHKAPLDFPALMEEPTPLAAYAMLQVPVLIMRGEFAPPPTALIAAKLAAAMDPGALRVLDGAGHMGPVTHAAEVAQAVATHIFDVEIAAVRRSRLFARPA